MSTTDIIRATINAVLDDPDIVVLDQLTDANGRVSERVVERLAIVVAGDGIQPTWEKKVDDELDRASESVASLVNALQAVFRRLEAVESLVGIEP